MSQHQFSLNGHQTRIDAPDDMPLLWVIRDILGLTGTKYSCGIGQCGSCTIHIDGRAARSCIVQISDVSGKEITTIEGLSTKNNLHPVQQAWLDERVSQCGFCQPGMIMQLTGLLNQNPNCSLAELQSGLDGNLCRCGTYPRVLKALTKISTGRTTNET
jgi:isoquinoline 1-oxidoreductase subunit alpha